MFIETHAHLYFDKFDDDREAVIQRAFDNGIEKIINIATDVESARKCIELAEQYKQLYAAVGMHPNDSAKLDDNRLAELRALSAHEKVVAIGEIGLDFYWDTCPVATQEKAFRTQIAMAKELEMPIVIHNRDAGRAILDVLKSEGTDGLAAVFHCFSEGIDIAREIVELGFHLSFTGNLTFKKSELPAVAAEIPLNRLMLETDCPFLSPEPRRGRRNEPAHVVYVAEKLAEIKGLALSEVAAATTANAEKFFGFTAGN